MTPAPVAAAVAFCSDCDHCSKGILSSLQQDVFDFNTNAWRANVAQMSVLRSDSCAAFANGLCVPCFGCYSFSQREARQ